MSHLNSIMSVRGISAVALLVSCATLCSAFQRELKSSSSAIWEEYYPLAVGNSWTYTIIESRKAEPSRVTWEVTGTRPGLNTGKEVYIVIPSPRPDPSEDFKALLLTEDGLKDVGSDPVVDTEYILRFPIRKGDEWKLPSSQIPGAQQPSVRWRVLSVNESCTSGRHKFTDCVVVERVNEDVNIKMVTSYARFVGPVKYLYFKHPPHSPDDAPFATVTLLSYSLSEKN